MITNAGDISLLSLWEIFDILEINTTTGLLELNPLSPSIIQYKNVVESDEVSLDYNKRLHYLSNDLISSFLTDELWAELIRVYLKYLNDKIYQEIINLDKMIYEDDWFINAFYDQFSSGLVAENIVSLNINDKAKVFRLAKYLSNLKGTKLSFEVLLGLLNQDLLIDIDEKRVFENTIVSIIEDERFNHVDPTPNPKLFRLPFTYGFESNDETFDDYIEVMSTLHPIGFNYKVNEKESLDRQEIIKVPEIDFYLRGLRTFRLNGIYDRSGYVEINSLGYSLKNYPILIDENGEYYFSFTLTNT